MTKIRRELTSDVAIYTPSAGGYYDRARGRAGGAERQMTLLARTLAAAGVRVAHIVFEPRDPVPLPPGLRLVYRHEDTGGRTIPRGVREGVRIWRALRTADARVFVIRTGTSAVGIVALFARLHGRRLIFSSASNADFVPDEKISQRLKRSLYRLGVRLADTVVVQSHDQVELARARFPRLRDVVHIPSFCEPAEASGAAPGAERAFLWIGRLDPPKRPDRYVELARALPDAGFLMIPTIPKRDSSPELERLRQVAEGVPNLDVVLPLPHARLMELIGRSVAIVNTSRYEGMPNVFLEAWAQGVPVLTLEFDPDGVVEQRCLGIVAAGSWDRFVAGARALYERRDDRHALAQRVRAYVDQAHSPTAVGTRWREVIDRVARG